MIIEANVFDILPEIERRGPYGAVITDPPLKVYLRDTRDWLHNTHWLETMRDMADVVIFTASEEAADKFPPPDRTIIWHWPPQESRIFVYGEAHLPNAILESWPEPEAFGHGSCKPLPLLRQLVRGTEGKVLDCFCGTGTTGVACKEQGRDFLGVEADPVHAATARRRLAEVMH